MVEAFESYDDAMDRGVEYITEMGEANKLSEMEISDEVSEFVQFKDTEMVEWYCCNVEEAHQ
jgi:hypothetical protein